MSAHDDGMLRGGLWEPTFGSYLTAFLARYRCLCRLVTLPFEILQERVTNKSIDIVFCNPSEYIRILIKSQAKAFLAVRRGDSQDIDHIGGVIVRSVYKHQSILTLPDLVNHPELRFCAVFGFSGWEVQLHEMLKHNVNLLGHMNVRFVLDHYSSIIGVLNNTCDIGLARTSTIEEMIRDDVHRASEVFVIGERSDELGFSQLVSTELYPEWPLVSLTHLPYRVIEIIARALLALNRTSLPALRGGYAGFGFPRSYSDVARMLIAIDDAGTGECYPGTHREGSNPGQCVACLVGTTSHSGIGSCIACPLGTFANESASTFCHLCQDGTSTEQSGASTQSQCVSLGPNFLIVVVATLSGIVFVLLLVLGVYWCVRMYRRFKMLASSAMQIHDCRLQRIRKAVGLMQTLNFPFVVMKLSVFKQLSHLQPHEFARDAGNLTFIDTWHESLEFSRSNPVIFNSHQWLSLRNPDPHGIHFESIVAAGHEVCALHGHTDEEVYVWVDYLSIPQQCIESKLNAISSLAVYTCLCRYFIVVAPDAIHCDSNKICDAISYAQRGWCRLEQWAFMGVNGVDRMFLSDGIRLTPLGQDVKWLESAAYVFEGDFSVETDKHAIVDVVLGLYGFMLIRSSSEVRDGLNDTNPVFGLICERGFPDKYVDGLDVLLKSELIKARCGPITCGAFSLEDVDSFLLAYHGYAAPPTTRRHCSTCAPGEMIVEMTGSSLVYK